MWDNRFTEVCDLPKSCIEAIVDVVFVEFQHYYCHFVDMLVYTKYTLAIIIWYMRVKCVNGT